MTDSRSDSFLLERPFGEACRLILNGWWSAAQKFAGTAPTLWKSEDFASRVSRDFKDMGGLPTQTDPHLTDGLFDTLRTLPSETRAGNAGDDLGYTRPYLLLLNHFSDHQILSTVGKIDGRRSDRHNRPKQYLFSPYYFLRQMLTAPGHEASEAYAHAVVRAELFTLALDFFSARGRSKKTDGGTAFESIRAFIEFSRISASLQKADAYRRNGDTFYTVDATDFLIGHLLASRGLAVLTFAPGTERYTNARKNELPLGGRDTFLASRGLVSAEQGYEFRILDHVTRLPSPAELSNELDGLPLPIPGASTIFAEGLRSTTSRGVVGRLSGESGAGKTTFALALASSLAPLGIATRYISCEEAAADLRKRIVTLTPPFVARTSTFPKSLDDWFHARHLDELLPEVNRRTAMALLDRIITDYKSANITLPSDSPPGLIPLFVVLDGVHELLRDTKEPSEVLSELLDHFRRLGAFVLILTAEISEPAVRELDYAVDFVLRLQNVPSKDASVLPERRLVLHKTRLQYSRHGSHFMHISRNEGVKIFPQLPAQLDRKAIFKWRSPDKEAWYDFLQKGAKPDSRPLVRIYNRSQVLVSGRGSGGKAAFALKLLMKPLIGKEDVALEPELSLSAPTEKVTPKSTFENKRRILIVSFLYQRQYYVDLAQAIGRTLRVDSQSALPNPDIHVEVLALYPGYLAPEVLLGKVAAKLSQGAHEGFPFEAVLIDGLHNVFLQFPNLQDASMLWPIMFELLRITGSTVVTTHTQFDVYGMQARAQVYADVETATRRVGPLLQALMNSSDFYLDVSPEGEKESSTELKIKVVNALGQDNRSAPYYWDRSKLFVRVLES